MLRVELKCVINTHAIMGENEEVKRSLMDYLQMRYAKIFFISMEHATINYKMGASRHDLNFIDCPFFSISTQILKDVQT